MSGQRLECPECGTALRLKRAFGPREMIDCPKCDARFQARAADGYRAADRRDDRRTDTTARKPDRPRRDDDRPRRKKKAAGGNATLIVGVALGGVALAVVVGVVVWAMTGRAPDRPPEQLASNPPPVQPQPQPPQPQPQPPNPAPPRPPAEGGNDGLPAAVLQAVRAATVQVAAFTPGGQTSGTGFFAVAPGLVVTNAHVIDMLDPDSPLPVRIDLTQNSGEPGERTLRAEVVTVDRETDLALLRVAAAPGGAALPAPLPVGEAKGLGLTQKVYVFGFPFGTRLGKDITVSPSAVSSLRNDGQGRVERVQVNGGIHPGNSGGPVVDAAGTVVGVAVSGIRNTQIQFAIPGEQVDAVAGGRLTDAAVGDTFKKGDATAVKVALTASDPRRGLKEVGVEWWLGPNGQPRPAAASAPAVRPGDGPATFVAATYDPATGKGEAEVALPAVAPNQVVWVRPRFRDAAGRERWAAAKPFSPLPPLEAVPATLGRQREAAKAGVELKVNADLRLRRSDGVHLALGTKIAANWAEDRAAADPNGNATVRMTGDQPSWVETLDGDPVHPLVPQAPGFRPLTLALSVDGQGTVVTRKAEVGPSGPGIGNSREAMESLGEQMLDALELLAIPVPAGEVRPGQTWRATRPLPLGAGRKADRPAIDVVYTYRGKRTHQGRDFVVVEVTGTLRGVAGRAGKAEGQVRGEATLDAAAGRVAQARVVVDLTVNLFFRDADVRAAGRIEADLARRVQGVAAPVRPGEAPSNPLVGVYSYGGSERDGKPLFPASAQTRVTIDDKTISWTPLGGTPARWHYTLVGPAGKDGGDVNISLFGEGNGYPGIYRIEGDTLTVCFNGATATRPTRVVTVEGSGLMATSFKRTGDYVKPTSPPVVLRPLPQAPDPFKNDPNLRLEPDRPLAAGPAVAADPAAPSGELFRLEGHDAAVNRLVYNRDGTRLASAGKDGTVILWDVAAKKEAGRLTPPKEAGEAVQVAFSADGKFVLTGHKDNGVRLWDAAAGAELRKMEGPKLETQALAFSANARYAIGGGVENCVRVWDVATGKLLRRLDVPTGGVAGVAFSPDGTKILSGIDRTARVWDVATGKEVSFPKPLIGSLVAYSQDGRQILTTAGGQVGLYEAATGKELQRYLVLPNNSIRAAALSADGKRVAAGGSAGVVLLYDLDTKKLVYQSEPQPRFEGAIAFSPGGGRVALGDGKAIRVLAFSAEAAPTVGAQPTEVRRFVGMERQAGALAVSPDGRRFAAVEPKGIRVWEVASGRQVGLLPCAGDYVNRLAFAADGKTLVSAGGGYGNRDEPFELDIRVWDVDTGKTVRQLKGHRLVVHAIALSPDGSRLLSGGFDRTMRLWDLNTGDELAVLSHPGTVSGVAFTADGRRGLSAGGGTVLLWDLENKREVRSFDKHPVTALFALPDGKHALTATSDGTLRTWELETGREVNAARTQVALERVSLSADGSRALLDGGKTVRLWDVAGGKEVARFDHPDGYGGTVLAADGGQMVSSTPDKVVRLLRLVP